MVGLRGFPNVQGGVETHAENLCPLLAELGCSVEVIARSTYQPKDISEWRNVRVKNIWAPRSKGLETIVHTFLGVLYAGLISRPDILHIQAIGPALVTPLARLLGLRVVVTHHGPDYDRQKWGKVARGVLMAGERFGMRLSHGRIVISEVIRAIVRGRHRVATTLIPNGVELRDLPSTDGTLRQYGLTKKNYVLLVSRLVAEKRHLDLIAAFRRAQLEGWKLVLVGACDHPDEYQRSVIAAAGDDPDVVMAGFQSGLSLRELYTHAGAFVLPSSHEGLPIAMLEALSFGLPVLASDIPANLEVGLPAEQYFRLGDVDELAHKLRAVAANALQCVVGREWVAERYDWRNIARQTMAVYAHVLARP